MSMQQLRKLAARQKNLRIKIDELKAKQSEAQNEFDDIRKNKIPELMEDLQLENPTLKGIGKIELRPDVYCSVLKDNRDEFHEWLEDNGFGDLIQGSVNNSTLKAWVKEQIKNGTKLPDCMKVTPYTHAVVKNS